MPTLFGKFFMQTLFPGRPSPRAAFGDLPRTTDWNCLRGGEE